jgi:hypothetical protein
MRSTSNNSASAPIPFPSSSRVNATPVTEADRAIAREHDTEIHELSGYQTRAPRAKARNRQPPA